MGSEYPLLTFFYYEVIMTNVTKIDNLLEAFMNGEELTQRQIVNRFGYASDNSARAAVTALRFKGFPIYGNKRTNAKGRTMTKYRLGTPSRSVIGAGFRQLANA
jgi:hypothetical protein